MSLERRAGGVYHYTHRRIGKRVVKVYAGAGYLAQLGQQLDDLTREQRKHRRIDRALAEDRRRQRTADLRDWLAGITAGVAAALLAAGWHQHNREWRRKRGATMSDLATAGRPLTWVPSELKAAAGELDPEVAKKAAKGDRSVAPAVDEFLRHPAAVALWGDVGRRVLQKWVKRYAGDDLTTQRAVLKFAAGLREQLAGPTPSALDVLLAERVVVAWVFLSYCEGVYAGGLDTMTWATATHHTKRIELAHRNLMAACRTLAKVKRTKLPDVFALVNLAPPTPPNGSER